MYNWNGQRDNNLEIKTSWKNKNNFVFGKGIMWTKNITDKRSPLTSTRKDPDSEAMSETFESYEMYQRQGYEQSMWAVFATQRDADSGTSVDSCEITWDEHTVYVRPTA